MPLLPAHTFTFLSSVVEHLTVCPEARRTQQRRRPKLSSTFGWSSHHGFDPCRTLQHHSTIAPFDCTIRARCRACDCKPQWILEHIQHARDERMTNTRTGRGCGGFFFEHRARAVSRLRTGCGLQELPIRRPGFGSVCRPDSLAGFAGRNAHSVAANQAGPSGDPSKRRNQLTIPGVPTVGRASAPCLDDDASKK